MRRHPENPASRYAATAGTLALHAALIAAVATGLSDRLARKAAPVTVQIALLPAAPPSAPAARSAAPPQAETKPVKPRPKPAEPEPRTVKPEPKPVKRKRRPAKPSIPPQPATSVREQPRPPATAPAAAPAQVPATEPPLHSAPAASSAQSARPPASPVKTGVSISASYAASNRKPPYPRLSRINDEQGTVVLRVLVRADGSAGAVQVESSSGYPLLDESAKSTVESWRFKPATIDGKPLSEWYRLAIPFTLQDD